MDLSPQRNFISMQSEKAMAETLFGWAIERGDHVTVARLMLSQQAAIDVNNVVCHKSSTPVERSASLGHLELTKLILMYGADVNKSLIRSYHDDCRCDGRGALRAIFYDYEGDQDTISNLVHVIVNAGGTMCSRDVLEGVQNPMSHVLRNLVLLTARAECTHDWMRSRIFHEAALRLDSKAVMLMLEIMVSDGVDLEFERLVPDELVFDEPEHSSIAETPEDVLRRLCSRFNVKDYGYEGIFSIARCPPQIIDILTQRGHIKALRRLNQLQVKYTNDTLVAAIQSRSLLTVQYVLGSGVPVDCFSKHYLSTPLAEAIRLGCAGAIPLLLQRLDLTRHLGGCYHYCALLSAASQRGDMQLLECLLTMVDRATGPVLGWSLINAAKYNQTEVGLALLNAGASLDITEVRSVFGERSVNGDTWSEQESTSHLALIYAVWNRNLVLARALMDHLEPVRTRSSNPRFRLDIASVMGCATLWNDENAMIEELKRAGWSVTGGLLAACQPGKQHFVASFLRENPSYKERDLALARAIGHRLFLVAQELTHHGARFAAHCLPWDLDVVRIAATDCPELLQQFVRPAPIARPGVARSMLSNLIECEREDVAQTLLEDGSFESPLHVLILTAIVSHATLPFITKMLELDMDVNRIVKTSDYRCRRDTALLAAVRREDLDIVSLLLKRGADVNLPAIRGLRRTPIQQAAEIGSIAMVQLLLDMCADVHAPSAVRGGVTSIQAAAIGGFIGIVELLIKHGEDFRAPGAMVDGRTALEGAAEHGRFDMIVYLTDLDLYDIEQYESAIRFAECNGHRAIVELLENDLTKARLLCGKKRATDGDLDADGATNSEHLLELIMSRISKDAANTDASETLGIRDDYDVDDDSVNTLPSFPVRGARVVDLDGVLCDEDQACESVKTSHMDPLRPTSISNDACAFGAHHKSDQATISSSMADLSLHLDNNNASTAFGIQPLFSQAYVGMDIFTLPQATGITPVNLRLPGMGDYLDKTEGHPSTVETHESQLTIANLDPTAHQRAPVLTGTAQVTLPLSLAQEQVVGLHPGKHFKCPVPDCSFSADRNDTFARHMVTHQPVQMKRKHKCQRCGSAYSRRDTLRAHLKHCTGRPSRVGKK